LSAEPDTGLHHTANPILRGAVFNGPIAAPGEAAMSVRGVVDRTALLLVLAVGAAAWTWAVPEPRSIRDWLIASGLVAVVLGVTGVVRPRWTPVVGPLFALTQGVVLGAVSQLFEGRFHGVVVQAVGASAAVLLGMLVVHAAHLVRITEKLRAGVTAALIGLGILAVAGFGLRLLGVPMPLLDDPGIATIAFSLAVTVLAAFTLALDFDTVERGVAHGNPAWMDWYAAFGVVATLLWLYVEMVRLLARLRRTN
jgi:uncharacterized YccA/Bax inhibitor family protein